MKKIAFIVSIILLSNSLLFGQDTLSILEPKSESTTSFYFITNWSNTFRRLEENDGVFGDSLGARADETPYNLWSFGIGYRSMLTKYLMFEGGMSIMRNGEQYSFTDTDTSNIYKAEYTYVAMPLKLNYTYGRRLKVIVGGGVVPQMLLGFKKNIEWEATDKTKGSEEVKIKEGYNTFVISAVVNLGIEYEVSAKSSVLFVPEYKTQLNSSFGKIDSYKHFGRSIGFNIGLTYKL